jgi:hypothetical protein
MPRDKHGYHNHCSGCFQRFTHPPITIAEAPGVFCSKSCAERCAKQREAEKTNYAGSSTANNGAAPVNTNSATSPESINQAKEQIEKEEQRRKDREHEGKMKRLREDLRRKEEKLDDKKADYE